MGRKSRHPFFLEKLLKRILQTTVQDLRKAFLPYGPIHSIDLPTLPSKLPPSSDPTKPPPPPRARGFAFVWFLTRHDAEKAIEGINGKPIKKGPDGEGRMVAVDWALSKEKWQEATKVEEKKEGEKKSSDSGSDSGSESESDSELGEGSDEESDKESSDGEDASVVSASEESSNAGENEEEEEEEPVKPTLPTVDVGSTLFIRNLPFETTELELNTLFRSFGPLRYAKITIDKATGRSRGTGFVCFWKNEHADEVIEEAQRVAMETGANSIPVCLFSLVLSKRIAAHTHCSLVVLPPRILSLFPPSLPLTLPPLSLPALYFTVERSTSPVPSPEKPPLK